MKVCAFLFFCLVFIPLRIQAAEPPEVTLPPVVVTATRLQDVQEPITNVPGKVIIVTAEEIEELGAKTVQEVLQYQTGIVLYDSIGNEFQQTIDLRGFNGLPVPATSVFVDGVKINEPDFNQTNFDLIPTENIERLEILPGTATVFGRNALGGVINITTKRGSKDRPHFGFDIGAGSFGRQKYSIHTDGPLPLDNFDYYFSATRELTQGFREDSGGRITKLFGKLGYRLGDQTDATLSYTRVLDHLKQAGSLPGSVLRVDRDDNLTPGDFFANDHHQVAVNLRQKLPAGFSLAVNTFYRRNDSESFVVGLFGSFRALVDYTQTGGALQLTHESRLLGNRNSINLGFEYGRNWFSNKTSGSFSANKSTGEHVVGIYLQDTYDLSESLSVNAGFRSDWSLIDFKDRLTPAFSFEERFSRVSPKAGITFNPYENLGFYFSYSEGFRVPVADEFAAFGPPPFFTPFVVNLKPVRSRNFEIGMRGRIDSWLEGSLAFFYMPVRDEIIFLVTDPSTFTGQNGNIDRTLRRGIEASLKARFEKLFDVFINYTVTKATFETDVQLFSGQVSKGDELPLVPRHRVSAGINVRPLEGLTVSLFGNYVSKRFLNNDEPNNARRLADYFVLGSRLAYQWKDWTGHVTVNNLTDKKYSTFGTLGAQPFRIPAPGINVFGGLSFRY